MARPELLLWVACTAAMTAAAVVAGAALDNIGVNWGPMESHPIDPSSIVEMLKVNGIKKVKLFDADESTLSALAGTGIEVMVAIPNDQLETISSDYDNAKKWVKDNVTRYDYQGGVKMKYVAVGNEPFLSAYKGAFMKATMPALENIQRALDDAGVGDRIKATVPLNADVYDSPQDKPVPSAGNFRQDIRSLMVKMVRFLHAHKSAFVVNIYPFLSLYQNPNFPLEFAFFDGVGNPIRDHDSRETYNNVFDANLDTLVWSLKKAGVPDLKIIIGEVGWPTDGAKQADATNAKKFYDGFLKTMAKKQGTPMHPGVMDVYLFGLIDENLKSVLPGFFERHWGLFTYDGKPKFPVDLSGQGNDEYLIGPKVDYLLKQWCVFKKEAGQLSKVAKNIDYACQFADCSALTPGSSCGDLGTADRASYAFNMYFQMQDQDVRACDFEGLARIVTQNQSTNKCLFPVQIVTGGACRPAAAAAAAAALLVVVGHLLLFF